MKTFSKFLLILLLLAMLARLHCKRANCNAARRSHATPVVSVLTQGTEGFPWWNDTVFYEIFVRSFRDSDGDGIGDFNGITEKLDYLQELGIKGIVADAH